MNENEDSIDHEGRRNLRRFGPAAVLALARDDVLWSAAARPAEIVARLAMAQTTRTGPDAEGLRNG
jgi:hypothetical protein